MFLQRSIASLLLVALMGSGWVLFSQTATGEVNGTIVDQTGAGVSGSVVKLVNQATQIETQVVSNPSGFFTIVNVRPGTYVLRVEAQGFKTAQVPQFDVGVSQTVTRNVALTVGDVSQTVDVSSEGELVQQSSSELGTVIQERVVQDLP